MGLSVLLYSQVCAIDAFHGLGHSLVIVGDLQKGSLHVLQPALFAVGKSLADCFEVRSRGPK